jgi:hypothetical protein
MAQSRAEAITLSVYPGPECEAAVTGSIDPRLLIQALPLIPDTVDVEFTNQTRSIFHEREIKKSSSGKTARCGDIYLITKGDSVSTSSVSVIGFPNLIFRTDEKTGKINQRVTSLFVTSDGSNRLESIKITSTVGTTPFQSECDLTGIVEDSTSRPSTTRSDVLTYQCFNKALDDDYLVKFSEQWLSRYSISNRTEGRSTGEYSGSEKWVKETTRINELTPAFLR